MINVSNLISIVYFTFFYPKWIHCHWGSSLQIFCKSLLLLQFLFKIPKVQIGLTFEDCVCFGFAKTKNKKANFENDFKLGQSIWSLDWVFQIRSLVINLSFRHCSKKNVEEVMLKYLGPKANFHAIVMIFQLCVFTYQTPTWALIDPDEWFPWKCISL